MTAKNNNFAMLRHLAALGVLFAHSFTLSGVLPDILRVIPSLAKTAEVSVSMFFVMSGYLVTQSMNSSGDIGRYLKARALRIYPGFVVCILFCALAGACFSTLSAHDYFSDAGTRGYILRNMAFRNEVFLPGVFMQNPERGLISGSFWTLTLEVSLYIVVPFAWWLGRRIPYLQAAIFCALTFIAAQRGESINPLHATLYLSAVPTYYCDFLLGALIFSTRGKPIARVVLLALPLVVALLFAPPLLHGLLHETGFAIIVLAIAQLPALNQKLAQALSNYDTSYGIYLYGFFIQQALVVCVPHLNGWWLFGLSLPTTALVALASWCWVERPALAMKNRRLPLAHWGQMAAAGNGSEQRGE